MVSYISMHAPDTHQQSTAGMLHAHTKLHHITTHVVYTNVAFNTKHSQQVCVREELPPPAGKAEVMRQ